MVEDGDSPVEKGTVKLARGVGTPLMPVPTAEVTFAVADAMPIDAPVESGGVGTVPGPVPMGALELPDTTGTVDEMPLPVDSGTVVLAGTAAVPTGISVEFNPEGALVPKEMGMLELADSVGTALIAVSGGAVPGRVVFAVGAGAVPVDPLGRDRVRPRRSASLISNVSVVLFMGVDVVEFNETGGRVTDG